MSHTDTAPRLYGCRVEGCQSRANYKKKQLCNKHYLRLARHGDVTAVLRTPNNVASDWVSANLDYDGENCLIWPFSRNNQGYAAVWIDKKRWLVHRYYCTQKHGAAPSLAHHASHVCGNGKIGCVNPSHVEWKTPIENNRDKTVHGTLLMGERHPSAKINADIVRLIRSSPGTGVSLAVALGLSESLISNIRRKKRWSHVE